MAREEEEEAVGAGDHRGVLRYSVGNEVEVRMTDPGFHSAYYEATVAARLPVSGGYEVIYSTLVEDGGGGPLREATAAANVRPRPPPPPPAGSPRCDLNVFDMVEVYHNDGWWVGVVSGAWPASTAGEPRYAVSFPAVREVVELPASLVRPRRVFVRGRWMDVQEVVPRMPQYDEGSNVEVIWHEGKQGTTWMTATIIKMVSSANYVVRHGNGEGSIEVLHSRYIRPTPIFDPMKFDYDWEPSAEVEVYRDGIWSPGVISDVGSCGSSRYAVRVKRHIRGDEDDYMLVSSAFLRPCCNWDGQEWRPCSTKKHARKRKYTVSVRNSLSPVFSTPEGDSDQDSSIPNKRAWTDNMGKDESHLGHSLYPSQVTTGSSSKHDMDIEAPSGKHATRMKKLDCEKESKRKECMLASSKLPKLSYTLGDGKWRNCLMKTLASGRVNSKSSYVDVIEISDNSGYGDVIEISDSSSCNSNRRKKRRQNPPEEGLPSRHVVHPNQESWSTSNLSLAKNPPLNHDLLLAVTRHPEVQPCSHVLPPSVALLESLQAPSNNDGEQLIPLPGQPVSGTQPLQGLAGMNETKEPPLSDRAHSEAEFMAPDDCTARDENYEMCQEVNELKSWVADNCNEEADTGLITSKNSKQSIVDRSYGEANSKRQRSRDSMVPISRKLGPSSSAQQGVKADLSCMPVLNDSTISTLPLVTTSSFHFLSPKEMEVPEGHRKTPDAMEMNNITGISPEEEAHCNLEVLMNSKEIVDVSHHECNPSSQHALGPCLVPISWKAAGALSCITLPPEFVTSSLLLRPHDKMEVFSRLPQNPHFRELQDCHPEFREGKALGLMVSFANIAESIKNMHIQDEAQVFEDKMSSLSELEENGFEVGALKARLENLLRIKNRRMDLKDKKASLDKGIHEKEVANSEVEQRLKVLDVCIKEMEQRLLDFQEKKASLVAQNTANCWEISKIQAHARQVEESFMSAECDFNSTAASPW